MIKGRVSFYYLATNIIVRLYSEITGNAVQVRRKLLFYSE